MATFLYPPVSVTTLPPLGGATAANQILEIAQLTAINAKVSTEAKQDSQIALATTLNAKDFATETTLGAINTKTPALVGGKVPVDTGLVQGLTDTQLRASPVPVSMASAPLPTGAATEAKQDDEILELVGINTELDAQTAAILNLATEATLSNVAVSTADSLSELILINQKLPASLGAKTSSNSLSVVPATDSVFTTSDTPQGTSTFATQTVVHGSVSTFTVPAGAKRMVVYNNADASNANRIRRGNVAVPPDWSTSVGPILGVGSFTSEIPATTFTCIAENSDSSANVSVEYFY